MSQIPNIISTILIIYLISTELYDFKAVFLLMGHFWCQPKMHVQFMKHKITCMLTLELDMTNIVTNNYPNKQNIVFMYVILTFFVHILVHTLPTFDTLHSSTQAKRILTHKTFLFFVLMDMTLMVTIITQLLKKWIWV